MWVGPAIRAAGPPFAPLGHARLDPRFDSLTDPLGSVLERRSIPPHADARAVFVYRRVVMHAPASCPRRMELSTRRSRARSPGLRGRPVDVGGADAAAWSARARSAPLRRHSAMSSVERGGAAPHSVVRARCALRGRFEADLAIFAVSPGARLSLDEAFLDLTGTERCGARARRGRCGAAPCARRLVRGLDRIAPVSGGKIASDPRIDGLLEVAPERFPLPRSRAGAPHLGRRSVAEPRLNARASTRSATWRAARARARGPLGAWGLD